MKALILNSKVVQVDESGFPVHQSMQWVDCPEDCKAGWILIDGVLQPEPEPVKTLAESIQEIQGAIKSKLHEVAAQRNYDSPLSIATYTDSKNTTWAAEAKAFTDWRDDVWIYAIEQLALFEAGHRDIVTVDEFLTELPDIAWPESEE